VGFREPDGEVQSEAVGGRNQRAGELPRHRLGQFPGGVEVVTGDAELREHR
jgi:hypothetical protein